MTVRPATGFVLAGGQSTRLGQDKVLLPWKGGTLLEDALGKLRALCSEVYICTNRLELSVYAPVIADFVVTNTRANAGIGPLGGVVAALESSATDWNVFLPVDLPLLPGELLSVLLQRVQSGSGLACIPYLDGRAQPLCAIYHRDLLLGLRRAVAAGNYKVIDAVMAAAEEKIDCFEIHAATSADWFLNLNTPQQMEQAQALLAKRAKVASRPVSSK